MQKVLLEWVNCGMWDRGTMGQKLSLDIYLYETGQTLVAGYVEKPMSLSFLKPPRYTTEYSARYVPDYKYENDTRQLYAWTDALTMKREETWSLIFLSRGFYDEFDMKMGLTHIYATAISAVDVFTTEYPAFSSNLIIDRSFLFVARSLASSAPVS